MQILDLLPTECRLMDVQLVVFDVRKTLNNAVILPIKPGGVGARYRAAARDQAQTSDGAAAEGYRGLAALRLDGSPT